MSSPTINPVSVQGYARAGEEHEGAVVIMDCEKRRLADESGSEQITYIPKSESWLRFTKTSTNGDRQLGANSHFYAP